MFRAAATAHALRVNFYITFPGGVENKLQIEEQQVVVSTCGLFFQCMRFLILLPLYLSPTYYIEQGSVRFVIVL